MLSRLVLVFIYRFEYLQCYLRHDGVSVGFDGHVSPFRKGNTVQSTGNPIISATNRGLSWKLVPVWDSSLCMTILGNPLLRLTRLGGRVEFLTSFAVGVGSISSGRNTVLPLLHCFNPCVCTVGNKPASVPSVGSADTASWYNVRLNRISRRLQVRTHLLEDHSFRPINNSENVLAHDPSRSNSPNNPQHFRPEAAVVLRAFAFARERERLAGETACKDVNSSSPNSKVCCVYVSILFCIRKVMF